MQAATLSLHQPFQYNAYSSELSFRNIKFSSMHPHRKYDFEVCKVYIFEDGANGRFSVRAATAYGNCQIFALQFQQAWYQSAVAYPFHCFCSFARITNTISSLQIVIHAFTARFNTKTMKVSR